MNRLQRDSTRSQKGQVLLLVPPFSSILRPNLGCHLLQAYAQESGYEVGVMYTNLDFAAAIKPAVYNRVSDERLCLELVFRNAAFAVDEPHDFRRYLDESAAEEFESIAAQVPAWLAHIGSIIREVAPKIVGCTCSFEQITASIALLRRVKEIDPDIVTIMGGANCKGEMAEGLSALGYPVDHVAADECDHSFVPFLEDILVHRRKPDPVIKGLPLHNMDAMPIPVFDQYFHQYRQHFPAATGEDNQEAWSVPFETSRGCWWGEKHQCTFCGLNGLDMAFREKSPSRALAEIDTLVTRYPAAWLIATDNIMPHRYFRTLLPQLAERLPKTTVIFYEQKANVSLAKAKLLADAGIRRIQPGIEALNSHILECMDKGVKANQNLSLLRYGRSLQLGITWNLLFGFPGDTREDYEESLALLQLIHHLEPPSGHCPLRVDRFSLYYENPKKYGIENLRPMAIYQDIFPRHADLDKIAYYFDSDYDCGAFDSEDVLQQMAQTVNIWQQRWKEKARPVLTIGHLFGDRYVLLDKRGLSGTDEVMHLDHEQAAVLLVGAKISEQEALAWAIERKLLVPLDGHLVPLATSSYEILQQFESEKYMERSRLPSPANRGSREPLMLFQCAD